MTEPNPSEMRVTTHDDAGVRLLTLSRPAKKNAFDVLQATQLWAAIEAASADPSVKVLALSAEGDYFSGGADVGIFMNIASYTPSDLAKVARLFEPLRACKKPKIAIVQGHSVGMGVTILPHFDLVYAADHVTFTTPFVRLGLVLEYGSAHTLSRLIGAQRAKELILRAAPLDAKTAEAWGLVTRTFGSDSLMTESMRIAREIAEHPAGALVECVRLIDAGMDATFDATVALEDAALASRYGSQENVEAITKMMAARAKR
ncbi:MAG: enoyl-CoA hydratase/isomerase family protein [Sandaracinaceae bacterium]